MQHGAILHLGSILEVGSHGLDSTLVCASDTSPPPPPPPPPESDPFSAGRFCTGGGGGGGRVDGLMLGVTINFCGSWGLMSIRTFSVCLGY